MSSSRLASNKVGVVGNLLQSTNTMEVQNNLRLGTSSIKLCISCRDLMGKNSKTKPSPICVVYNQPESTIRLSSAHSHHKLEWIELQKTEHIPNNANPDFLTMIQMEYRFEQSQPIRIKVCDVNSEDDPITDDDVIAYADCTLGNVMHAGCGGYVQDLQGFKDGQPETTLVTKLYGKIILRAEAIVEKEDEVLLELSGSSVGRWFSCFHVKSFYDVSKTTDVGTYVVAYKSDEVKGMNPYWSPARISGRSLCLGNWERSIRIQVFRKGFSDEWTLVGLCITNVNRLIYKKGDRFNLQTSDGKKTGASVSVVNCSISPKI